MDLKKKKKIIPHKRKETEMSGFSRGWKKAVPRCVKRPQERLTALEQPLIRGRQGKTEERKCTKNSQL